LPPLLILLLRSRDVARRHHPLPYPSELFHSISRSATHACLFIERKSMQPYMCSLAPQMPSREELVQKAKTFVASQNQRRHSRHTEMIGTTFNPGPARTTCLRSHQHLKPSLYIYFRPAFDAYSQHNHAPTDVNQQGTPGGRFRKLSCFNPSFHRRRNSQRDPPCPRHQTARQVSAP
jgi:hypothetical protein